MIATTLRLHSFIPASRANGPGLRAVVWVQGCTLGCPGCFNPETHPAQGGEEIRVDSLAEKICNLESQVEGVTISGGEPLQQAKAAAVLCQQVRLKSRLSIVVFTGFDWDEVQRIPHAQTLLKHTDVLIAGRYNQTQRLGRDLRGSDNKRLFFLTARYTEADFKAIPEAEVILTPNGEILVSGIDPVYLK
jgi:anaerobic ribonucleoside-triphosphate reductase activating protein